MSRVNICNRLLLSLVVSCSAWSILVSCIYLLSDELWTRLQSICAVPVFQTCCINCWIRRGLPEFHISSLAWAWGRSSSSLAPLLRLLEHLLKAACRVGVGSWTFRRNETLPRLYHVSYIYHHPCQKQPKHGQSLSIRNCPKHAIASRHSGCAGPLYETDMSVLPSELCTKSLTAVTYHILSLASGSQKPGKSNSFVFFVILWLKATSILCVSFFFQQLWRRGYCVLPKKRILPWRIHNATIYMWQNQKQKWQWPLHVASDFIILWDCLNWKHENKSVKWLYLGNMLLQCRQDITMQPEKHVCWVSEHDGLRCNGSHIITAKKHRVSGHHCTSCLPNHSKNKKQANHSFCDNVVERCGTSAAP